MFPWISGSPIIRMCPKETEVVSDQRVGMGGSARFVLMKCSWVPGRAVSGVVAAFVLVVSVAAGPHTAAALPAGVSGGDGSAPSGLVAENRDPSSRDGLSGPGSDDPAAAVLPTGTFGGGPQLAQGSGLSVSLAVGESAQGWEDPNYGECTSAHCRHLEIALHNASAGDYDVACWSSLDTERPWYSDRWHWPSSSYWSKGGCWYGFPGEQVWVVVNGNVQSNVVTWPQSSSQTGTRSGSFIQVSAGGESIRVGYVPAVRWCAGATERILGR